MAPEDMKNNTIMLEQLLKAIQQLQASSISTQEALAQLLKPPIPAPLKRNWSPSADKRLPFEIWEHILTFLYPSQIARLSRCSRTMYEIISASIVWSPWFKKAFGPEVILDTLPAMKESKSYMLYMCAVSSRVCEQCLVYAVPSKMVQDRAARPLRVLIPDAILARRDRTRRRGNGAAASSNNSNSNSSSSSNETKSLPVYVGEPMNTTWSIRMCLPCRQVHYLDYTESIPVSMLGQFNTYHHIANTYQLNVMEVNALLSRLQPMDYGRRHDTVFSEEEALRSSRFKYGGDVGLVTMKEPAAILADESKTESRIEEYRQR
ncbi:hypothetical protein BGZ83_000721 [Gryganskiella cystojenkinii]|nr:hypothetical protein BGZ83_000721 [Gryganskiella cystojenkinii]